MEVLGMLMKTRLASSFVAFLIAITAGVSIFVVSANASDQSEVRSAVQHVFDQLKAGQYAELYDGLPSNSRARLPRDRFVNGLQQTRSLYQLERIEIGPARV